MALIIIYSVITILKNMHMHKFTLKVYGYSEDEWERNETKN